MLGINKDPVKQAGRKATMPRDAITIGKLDPWPIAHAAPTYTAH